MEVKIKPFDMLPCELEEFTINGIKADKDDFGYGHDFAEELAPAFGCGYHKFVPNESPKQEVLDKYKISKEEYSDICEELECELCIEMCGCCS